MSNNGKDVRLFNVFFPVWLLWLYPPILAFVLPANFIIDSAVVLLCSLFLRREHIWKHWIKCIFTVWVFGFLADLLAAVPMFLLTLFNNTMLNYVNSNPFFHPVALLIVIGCIILGGGLIFILNYFITFRREGRHERLRYSLSLAIATAPYLFLLPTEWFY